MCLWGAGRRCHATMEGLGGHAMRATLGDRSRTPCDCEWAAGRWHGSLGGERRLPCDCVWAGERCHANLGGRHACMGVWQAKLCDPGGQKEDIVPHQGSGRIWHARGAGIQTRGCRNDGCMHEGGTDEGAGLRGTINQGWGARGGTCWSWLGRNEPATK